MKIPFTVDQFFSVFKTYNEAIWPAQIVAYLLALVVVGTIVKKTRWSDRFTAAVLGIFWIWVGAAYHLAHFSAINPAARFFGGVFIAQGIILLVFGCVCNRFDFGYAGRLTTAVGALFILFAMVLYPLLGAAFGHSYPAAPTFGVAPCPTTIFTFGVFLFARTRIPWFLFLLPLLWSLVGMSAAINLRVPQDYGLVVAGVMGTVLIFLNNRRVELAAAAVGGHP